MNETLDERYLDQHDEVTNDRIESDVESTIIESHALEATGEETIIEADAATPVDDKTKDSSIQRQDVRRPYIANDVTKQSEKRGKKN